MLIHPDNSCLLVIDIQDRMAPVIHDVEVTVTNCQWLIDIANRLNVPVLATEQYPQGLGTTVPSIRERIQPENIVEKIHFSAISDAEPNQLISAGKHHQIILIGMETHVCVLQTAIELKQQAHEVYVVEDCVSSRSPADKAAALERFRQCGIFVVTREMVAFEWLRRAGTDTFREVSKTYLR
ncbi:MAG: hydrolase [Oceanospirillales bacterium]|uniref:Nicotinamidase-related amidase n=1 Tax=Marinobacterium halophilum TaxID=267374 RepID=A0A2P8F083_9GAMM|nr:hydrolase [Marinobacterium halophilum]MBR9829588.1 hydrolase [Oceanospirillales bacterium]PSL15121.1 nicotinamidase-related amidase [Marinobacterium halophilum]